MLKPSVFANTSIYQIAKDIDKHTHEHQTDTACAWLVCHSQEGLCKIVSTYHASPKARAPIFGGKPVMRPRSMDGGAPDPCGRH